ncbi:MAG: endonuclease/exonuclease/phosphatase family protein [Thiotrichaceae bacterium]
MKILSWNILHGGGQRAHNIVATIKEHKPDIVTLQEFRHGKSKPILLEGLKDAGLDNIYAPDTKTARDNSLLIASHYDFNAEVFPETSDSIARGIKASFVYPEINLISVHLPHKKKQVPFFLSLQELPEFWLEENSLLIGDFNCGIPFEDSETKSFDNTHLFQHLLRQGWIDAWRIRHLKDKEFTWISTKNRNGFRYDHALVSAEMDTNIEKVHYDHSVREQGISDHSLLILEVDL